jgi:hypothetical protein
MRKPKERVLERPMPCGKDGMWGLFAPGVAELAERVRASVPGGVLERKRMRPRRYKRRSCWRCPILQEMDTMSGVTVLQQLECAAGNIRALAHKCKQMHDRRRT